MRVVEVVHVQWLDSECVNAWTELSEIEVELNVTHSCGMLIGSNDKVLVLCLSYDPETESANAIMHIPRKAIVKIRPICTINLKT